MHVRSGRSRLKTSSFDLLAEMMPRGLSHGLSENGLSFVLSEIVLSKTVGPFFPSSSSSILFFSSSV